PGGTAAPLPGNRSLGGWITRGASAHTKKRKKPWNRVGPRACRLVCSLARSATDRTPQGPPGGAKVKVPKAEGKQRVGPRVRGRGAAKGGGKVLRHGRNKGNPGEIRTGVPYVRA